jgi:DNA-binding SARP family transcriptional activator/DNA-binding HxlR family transcriptional regulator
MAQNPLDGLSSEVPAANQNFSPGRALEAIGERWSLLIIRDAVFHETTRFEDFERRLAVAPDILAERLDGFVGAGLMEARPHGAGEYILTEKGRNLEPVIVALTTWGDGWVTTALPPPQILERIALVSPIRPLTKGLPVPVLIEIEVLGAFVVKVGGVPVGTLAVGSQRLLAFLALHDRTVTRIAMAGTMWPDASEERAGISLRSALSRLDRPTHEAILSASANLSLVDAVAVDFRDAQALAHRLLRPGGSDHAADLSARAIAILSMELLPDWYDDWVVAEADDWRQLRMSALEAQARALIAAGRLAEAAGAARAAMKVEPLRESAHACLIQVHLAEGNQSEAIRVYERYVELLSTGLGLEPTGQFVSLLAGLRS